MTLKDGVISLAHDVEKRSATISNDLVHAWSLTMLGSVLEHFGHQQEALHHLESAKLKAALAPMGSVYITYVCYDIATVHYFEDRLLEALDAVKEAWKHAELIMSNSLMDQANISFLFSRILFSMNRDMEAWKYIEISLMNSSHLGNQHGIALALEYMGYRYLRRGDYLNAYDAYEAAVEKYLGTISEESAGTRCKDNMTKIKDKQRNPDLNVGFEKPSVDNDWQSLFYPAMQDISG